MWFFEVFANIGMWGIVFHVLLDAESIEMGPRSVRLHPTETIAFLKANKMKNHVNFTVF